MNSSEAIDAEIRRLLGAAAQANASRQPDQAEALLRQAQAIAPGNALVTGAMGMQALRKGDAGRARELLERAVAQTPVTPGLWLNLAMAHRACGDTEAELQALEEALKLDPYFFLALLQKATVFERQGKQKQAARTYAAFLACLPRGQALPASLKPAVDRAQETVQTNNAALEAFLRERIAAAREAHASDRQSRFDDCLNVLLGKQRVYVQAPMFMHFPGLPAIQFYDREEFPWLGAVESAWPDIREELLRALEHEPEGFGPYVTHPESAPLNQWRELNGSPRWSAFYLWKEGAAVEAHLAACPRTAEALRDIPRVDVRDHGPTAFFSVLKPGTRIPPHTGVTNTRLVVHLPLIVPPGCGFRVGSETRSWTVGKAWVFDDSIEHEAWNDSDELRALLIFDIWNPFLTQAERDLVRATTEAYGDYYGDPHVAGGL